MAHVGGFDARPLRRNRPKSFVVYFPSMAHFSSRMRTNSSGFLSASGSQATPSIMLKTRFSSALLRLLCVVAFALCFGAAANAQQNTITLTAPTAGERAEGNTQTFRLQLSRPATQRLTVRVDTFEGSAFELARPDGRPADYSGVHGDVTFDVGLTQVSIPVRTIGDNRYEFNETFGLQVSNPRYNGNATTTAQVNFDSPDDPSNPNSTSAVSSIP